MSTQNDGTPDFSNELNGVGPATADKLTDAGYTNYLDLAVADGSTLENEADIGEKTAQDVVKQARELADVGGFKSAREIAIQRREIMDVSFGVPEVDDLLGGGVSTQAITEVYGENSSGKSQVAHQIAVMAQLPEEHGGADGGVVFIDTEDTFRPGRIEDMVKGLDDDIKRACFDSHELDASNVTDKNVDKLVHSVLENIHVAKGFNSDHQTLLTEKALKEVVPEHEDTNMPVRGLIIDSLTAQFRAEYVGRGELANRQQKLNGNISILQKYTDRYNGFVLITNQVSSNPDSYFGDPTNPIGGNILGHASTYRIYLRNSKNDKRITRLVDAPELADGEAVMRITGNGLEEE